MKRIIYNLIGTLVFIILFVINFFALIFSNYGAYNASIITEGGKLWEDIFSLIGNILVIYFLIMMVIIVSGTIYIWYEYIFIYRKRG